MDSINDDGDLTRHLVVKKVIRLRPERSTDVKGVEVELNDNAIASDCATTRDGFNNQWNLACDIPMFPNRDDKLTIQISYGKKRSCLDYFKAQGDRRETIKMTYKAIADKLQGKGGARAPQEEASFQVRGCTIVLSVTVGSIKDFVASIQGKDAKEGGHRLPELTRDVIASRDSILQNSRPLVSILENIPITENALQVIENTIETLGNAHPLAKAVLTALSVPYQLLKNEREFAQNVNDLADAMLTTSKCLMDVQYQMKIASAMDIFASIIATLRDAALYIDAHRRKGRFGRFIGAQFTKNIEDYADNLIKQKNEFQMAMILQIARDVYKMDSMTSDEFLRRRLDPAKGKALENGCLEDTRVNILDAAKDWWHNTGAPNNILWIVGAPGAGKSTLATTIVKELAEAEPFCAKFFCSRDVRNLRDPRRIWRTLAYELAKNHEGVKAALMRILDEKKGDPQDDTVLDQFQQLIKHPLETHFKESRLQLRKAPYPVIIIDAIDECYSANGDDWNSLLKSLILWTNLSNPANFKLIVTGLERPDIGETLGGMALRIDLTTGEDVTEDSTRDIETFFAKKFAWIRKDFPHSNLPQDWPSREDLSEMTAYAAGLFLWADLVIKYVGQHTSGSRPAKRLNDVLSDIKPGAEGQSRRRRVVNIDDSVDRLYARMLFEAMQYSTPEEREEAKGFLAAVVLAKERLRKNDVVDILSAGSRDFNPDEMRESMESTLRELGPMIPTSADQELRICHKSVLEFLSSYERSEAAMKTVVEGWNRDMPDQQVPGPESFILNLTKENGALALACMHLVRRKFDDNIVSVAQHLEKSSGSLHYACHHWFEHLEVTGDVRNPGLKSFADAMRVAYRPLHNYAKEMIRSSIEAEDLIKHIHLSADFATQFISKVQREEDRRKLEDLINNLDVVRGSFQIAMVVSLSPDIDRRSTNPADDFLQKRLNPSYLAERDNEYVEGRHSSALRRAKEWLDAPEGPEQKNILWLCGAPEVGRSSIATGLVRNFSQTHLCAKVAARRDQRDPTIIWRTLAFGLAGLDDGLRGTIMETLYENPRPTQMESIEHQFLNYIVKPMQDQQFLRPLVFVIDALDECFVEDNVHWRMLLKTIADWSVLSRTFRLVVISRDIPDIRNTLEKVSYRINIPGGGRRA